ncbi:MAG: tetratricopeptide repeat protein [Bacteroidaceae bacterium]|nr:tetratricopeptide repeat protein [Bacteroidaceae bacterium]
MGEYSQAMTAFMQSERLDPQSPAVHAKEMLEDIYAFRNTDMINP